MFDSAGQFLESDRSLKMINLAKLNLDLDNFNEIFAEANVEKDEKIAAAADKIFGSFGLEVELAIIPEIPESDRDALSYVSGCFARQIAKSAACISCRNLLIEKDGQSLASESSFIAQVNRGGLTIPSEQSFLSCAHAWAFYEKILSKADLKSVLLSESTSPRKVFVLSFAKYLSSSHETRLTFIEQTCDQGHSFQGILAAFATKCFNIFSKNYISVLNSSIHENRKRAPDTESKRISSTLKSKKLTSEKL